VLNFARLEIIIKKTVIEKGHLSCGVDWGEYVRSTLQHGGMGGETAAGRPAGETGDTDCPKSGGSSPTGKKRNRKKYYLLLQIPCLL